MIQAIIVIVAVIILISTFFILRGLVRLYRDRQIKRAVFCTVSFGILPLLIWGCICSASIASKLVWAYLPVVFFSLIWVAGGFALAIFMRRDLKERFDAIVKDDPLPSDHWQLKCIGCGAGAIAIWAFGTFIGFGKYAVLEVVALCAMMFCLSWSLYLLWQCRDLF